MIRQIARFMTATALLFTVSCENSLLEHDHEHSHEHNHDTENNFRHHWHTEEGIYFTKINLTEAQITKRLNRLYSDFWDGDEVIADEFFIEPLTFRGKAISVERQENYKREIVSFRIPHNVDETKDVREHEYFFITFQLKLDNILAGKFKIDNWYTLKIKVIDLGLPHDETRNIYIYGKLVQ